jgi:hypothetical protein
MPRMTELVGYGFTVGDIQLPDVDDQGKLQDDGAGGIKTKPGKMLVLVDPSNGDQVKFPLSEEGRTELVRQLTGGLLVPTFASVSRLQ